MSGVHCHICGSSPSGYAFVYHKHCIEYSNTVALLQAQDVQKWA